MVAARHVHQGSVATPTVGLRSTFDRSLDRKPHSRQAESKPARGAGLFTPGGQYHAKLHGHN
jgi:hypothetical protein